MTAAELLDVAEVERLALRPGDMLVLKSPVRLSDDEFDEIKSRMRALIPDSVQIIVLEAGMDVAVIKAEDALPGGGAS